LPSTQKHGNLLEGSIMVTFNSASFKTLSRQRSFCCHYK
jgi:hypothetical protein